MRRTQLTGDGTDHDPTAIDLNISRGHVDPGPEPSRVAFVPGHRVGWQAGSLVAGC
jgi:hypothetical protein